MACVTSQGSGDVHLTCVVYAGNSTLYTGSSNGKVAAWDTRQNSCFLHWDADTAEIGAYNSRPASVEDQLAQNSDSHIIGKISQTKIASGQKFHLSKNYIKAKAEGGRAGGKGGGGRGL